LSLAVARLGERRGGEEGDDGRRTLESRVGDVAVRALKADPSIVRDEAILEPVRAVLDAVLPGLPDHPYEVRLFVTDSGAVNAFSMSGGIIVVDTALIAALDAPEELAAVFAHELSHMVHRDAWNALRASVAASAVLSAMSGSGNPASAALRDLLRDAAFLSFSRGVESRADSDALDYLAAAGLPAASFADALGKIHAVAGAAERLPEILSSHPDIEGRIEAARARAAELPAAVESIKVDWAALRRRLPSAFSE
jgi:predicted Zn-dependent protease